MKGTICFATALLTVTAASPFVSAANGQTSRVITAPPPVTQSPAPGPTSSQSSPMRTAPPPVMRNPNGPQADYQPAQPDEQFTVLAFTVKTGDDDLRSDSAAWVDLKFADGATKKCKIKDYGGDSWGNNTVHDNDIPQCQLQPARTFGDLKKTDIVLVYDGMTHEDAFESEDNWNVNEVRINAQDIPQHNYPCLIDVTGNPLVRMKGTSPDPNGFPENEGGTGSFDLTQTPSTC